MPNLKKNKIKTHDEIIEPLEIDVLGLPQKKVQPTNYNELSEYSNHQGIIPFLFMCFCTGGLYQLYFFYKSWKYIDDGKNNRINPALKSIFYFIFNFYLIDSYLGLSKKTNIFYSLGFHLIVFLNISFNLLNIVDESTFIFNTLSYLVLIPFLYLRNYYFDKAQEKIKKRKWLSKEDVKVLGLIWLIVITLIILILIFD